jgi:UDP-N-acetylglucosamine--N-acetylmuramyl-(pentapeptide) pyrophosphoryl-undecaprenol N-acetylglucosamine transferase
VSPAVSAWAAPPSAAPAGPGPVPAADRLAIRSHAARGRGGGTAGHIEPALALADALRRAEPGIGITCLGTERGLETRLVPMRGYDLVLIPAVPLPRSLTPELLSVPGRLADAVGAAAKVLDRTRARVLVGFGGYVAASAYLAARRRHVPIVVHEANVRPGVANRLGATFTRHVFAASPDAKLAHATR